MKRFNNNKGFTLGEMLITVAITVVLAAVSIVNVVPHMWNLRLKDADQAAHEIFVAAQYHLTATASSGSLAAYTDDQRGTEDTLYKGTFYESETEDNVYDIVVSPNSENNPSILDAILPFGAVDETMRTGGSYIITYNYNTATVLGVFYSYADRSYGYSFSNQDLTDNADALHTAMASTDGKTDGDAARAIRRHFPDANTARKTIGFYGGNDTGGNTDTDSEITAAPILNIDNGDTLTALITLSENQKEAILRNTSYVVQLKVVGTVSQKTEYKYLTNTDLGRTADSLYSYILDAYQDQNGKGSLRFSSQFASLYPGEDITVTACIAEKNSDGSYTEISKSSNTIKTNSLYAGLNDKQASVGSIRHLENLNFLNGNVPIETVSQVSDLSFKTYQQNLKGLVGAADGKITYVPVEIKQNLSYTGSYTGQKDASARQHLLSDISTDVSSGNGGVFGTLKQNAVLKVSDLEIRNIDVSATGHAGAILGDGEAGTEIDITNVLVWDKSATMSVKATGESSDAGGLVGHGDGRINISSSAASIYVEGAGNAGGIAGYDASVITVENSYASGHTYNGAYVNAAEGDSKQNEQRHNIIAKNGYAGGLVGFGTTAMINHSYTTASVYNTTEQKNVAVYVGNEQDNATYNDSGCYAVTSLNGSMVKEPSDFEGKADVSTKYVNDSTLLGNESQVAYPYTTISELTGSDSENTPWFISTHVGDWSTKQEEKVDAYFNNAEILQFIAPIPGVSDNDTVEVQFFYDNVFSQSNTDGTPVMTFVFQNNELLGVKTNYNQYVSKNDWRSDICKIEKNGDVTTYTINIDDITYNVNNHRGNFSNVILDGTGFSSGYDVTAQVVKNGVVISDPVMTNSIYGDKTDSDTVVISCGRHLQNISRIVGDQWDNVSNISLTSDIHWNSTSDSFFDRVKELRIDQNEPVDGVYTDSGIINDKKFLTLDGSKINGNSIFNGNGHIISDISFQASGNGAGLFSQLNNNFTLQNLTIQNGKIENEENIQNGGLFAGQFLGGTITNCYAIGENSVVRIGHSGNAGGLIGYMQSTNLSNCGASVYVQGNNAGGLVGDFNSGSMTNSFSGGRTTSGQYLQDAENKGYYNVQGYANAGGLVGSSGSGTISYCYSTSSVYSGKDSVFSEWGYTDGSGNAGGLIGSTYNTAAMNNCYAVGMVLGPKDRSGALIGYFSNSSFDSSMTGNYYLYGININLSNMEELPAVSSNQQIDTTGHMTALDYYSSNTAAITQKEASVHYYTHAYDDTLTSPYPYTSWTRQASNLSIHYGGWQIPVDKSRYCRIRLYDHDKKDICDTYVLHGTDWSSEFDKYTTQQPGSVEGNMYFTGWIDENGNTVSKDNFTPVISDITAYANYASTVTFYYWDPTSNQSTEIDAVLISNDGSVAVPYYPSFSNYLFDGWYTGNNSDGTKGTKANVVNDKISNPEADSYTAFYKPEAVYTYTMVFCYEKEDGTPGAEIASLSRLAYQRSSDNYASFNQTIDVSKMAPAQVSLDKVVVSNDDTGESRKLAITNGTVTMQGAPYNQTYYVLYKANPGSYTVQHIFEDSVDSENQVTVSGGSLVNGDKLAYSKDREVTITETKQGYAGNVTAAAMLDLGNVSDGWELDGEISQQEISEDGKTAITIKYRRKSFALTYQAPEAVSYIGPRMYSYGETVTLAEARGVGLILQCWNISYEGVDPFELLARGTFIMPAKAVQATAEWAEDNTAKVTVQFWQQKPFTKDDGNYTKDDYDYYGAYAVTCETGSNYGVNPDDALSHLNASSDFKHFHYNARLSQASVTVKADGSSTIDLYYDRDLITIYFYFDYQSGYWWPPGKYNQVRHWTGLYGEEFGTKFQWDNTYDWYVKPNGGSRLTFITYFHVEDNAVDSSDSNTMNLYGIESDESKLYTIEHATQNLGASETDYENGYTVKNSTDVSGGTFTLSEKYPNGFKLIGYRYYREFNNGQRIYSEFQSENSGTGIDIGGKYIYYNHCNYSNNGLIIYYKRKALPITLRNAVINGTQTDTAYQFNEPYETSYQDIKSALGQMTVTKPDNIDGDVFGGWYLDEACTKLFTGDADTKLTGPLQLFAKWDKVNYHVKFWSDSTLSKLLNTVDHQTGQVLYKSDGTIDEFPSIEDVPEGYEARWYYKVNRQESQFIRDRQIQMDLVGDQAAGEDGYYTINLYARLAAVKPVHLTYELLDTQTGKAIGQAYTTEETYTVGTAYHITPPEIEGYTYVSGADGVARTGTEDDPIELYYAPVAGTWYHQLRFYALYQDIDNAQKTRSVEMQIDGINTTPLSTQEELVESAPTVDGYTFVQSGLKLDDDSSTDYETSSSSQVLLQRKNGGKQIAAFWYKPVWSGTLSNTTAVYDGNEHDVVFTPNHMPEIGDNTVVYKYTYTRTLTSSVEKDIQFVWTDGQGNTMTSGDAPVNAGTYSVTVEVMLYPGTDFSEDKLTDESLLTVYRHSYNGSIVLTISPEPVVITSPSMTWTFDGQPHSFRNEETSDSQNNWTITINGSDVNPGTSPFTVTYLPTSTLTAPGETENTFTYAVKDGYLATNYVVEMKPGKLVVEWPYSVQHILAFSDVSGADPIQIEMYKDTASTSKQVLTVTKDSDAAVPLEGLKIVDNGLQTIQYSDTDPMITYIYTPDFDDTELTTDEQANPKIVLSTDSEKNQQILNALRPYLKGDAAAEPATGDNTATEWTSYAEYEAAKNADYRIVYRFTYTDEEGNNTDVTYLVSEDGSISDPATSLISGNVPTIAGAYWVSGEIMLQQRTVNEDGTGETWNDSNIIWKSANSVVCTVADTTQ